MTDEPRDQIEIRRARPDDQAEITAMVRRARLNPRNLDWSRFCVAERHGTIVGLGQVRVYGDGARELASLVVQRSVRGQGIASDIVGALLADDRREMYTLIDRRFAQHFQRWGFHIVDPGELPRSVMGTYRVGRVVTALGSALTRRRVRIVALKRP
jgi:N-acetylglutamate synthase-like GNAT family acetyltransferase